MLGHEFAAPRLGAIRPVEGARFDDVDPEAAEDGLAFRTGVGGQAQREGEAQCRAQRTIGDARIATAGVEQLAAVRFRVDDGVAEDAVGGPGLHTAADLVPFQFGVDGHVRGQPFGERIEAHEGRVPDPGGQGAVALQQAGAGRSVEGHRVFSKEKGPSLTQGAFHGFPDWG